MWGGGGGVGVTGVAGGGGQGEETPRVLRWCGRACGFGGQQTKPCAPGTCTGQGDSKCSVKNSPEKITSLYLPHTVVVDGVTERGNERTFSEPSL